MTVALYVTKIETIGPEKALVSVVIDCDLGRLGLDIPADSPRGDPARVLESVKEKLVRFGYELTDAAKPIEALRLSVPPQLK